MKKNRLSFIQKQFLVNSVLFEATPAYSIASFIKLDGILDSDRLERAWRRVFFSASILGSSVLYEEGEPVLVEGTSGDVPWSVVECPECEVEARAKQATERPFDLFKGPLVRCLLFRVSCDRHFLLLVQHHIVTDLFSKDLLSEAIVRAYDESSYIPHFVSYNSYVETEAAFLGGEAGEKSRRYWQTKMESGFETLRLPQPTAIASGFSASGKQRPWLLRHDVAGDLARSVKPPFLVLLTAYAMLLFRLSGQTRFLIAVPMTNRLGFQDKPLLGPCVNVLPVLVDFRDDDSFETIYDRIRLEMLRNHRHQSFPFMEIANLCAAERDPLRPWLLQAGFTNEPLMDLCLDGIESTPLRLSRSGAQMDLFFTWWKDRDSWRGVWEFNDEAFSDTEVRLWQGAFEHILAACLTKPEMPVVSMRLSDESETAALSGADRNVEYPLEKSMATHLRDSYALHAERPALIHGGNTTSYSEFSTGAIRIASRILATCGSGGRVVVLFEPSPDMIYALHGIVLSGNSYVPIGTDWPGERIGLILEDIEPCLVLTQEKFRGRFPAAPCEILSVEEIFSGPAVDILPEVSIAPGDSMYILYTSGTTGMPKGVDLPHSGLVNHLCWLQDRYRLDPDERCFLKTPYTFDVSVWEIFWPLFAGAALVIPDVSTHKDPREILELAVAENVTRLNFVPSLLSLFLDQEGLNRLRSLTDVQCIGEALPIELLERFAEALPGVRLHNLYGPTEASVSVTYWECGKPDIGRGTIPIGFPMANTQIYIVDDNGIPCLPLVKGEIMIGGTCLAKGYWNRNELTRERFISNPFGTGRLYRTGDWGRYALDGSIEYLERKDTQTKIRGIRIELGEIESRIRSLDGIENAAVVKGKTPSAQECLIVYYTQKQGQSIGSSDIRENLRSFLPELIIPEYCVCLDAFPVTENGKLDRKALPDRLKADSETERLHSRKPGSVEAVIANLWRQALGSPGDDCNGNFFDAGGNSLTLLSLRNLLEAEFGEPIRVAALFQRPTIAGMASLFEKLPVIDTEYDDIDERARKQKNAMRGLGARVRKGGC